MWYVKNLPIWERVVRIFAALFMAGCAYKYGMTPVGWGFAIVSVVTIVTGVIGYCPMCAIGGRPRVKVKV